ncbi:hypothetical protein CXB49_11010 [Chromobacterium sp. ATCC 53434]|uniref:hypothetical protein n=1 Tax=Chromobacterium sp. (strain ATCC 53434 / SC 14030) TaxID=2059672 RepID=UPI000C763DB0|nr:hypothetical protein [Chromobacterium sp. ATCC 53434]AUH51305.1 hypothetical protein CXB49_11010 [Chromobacterium sp. ATCC 53434]
MSADYYQVQFIAHVLDTSPQMAGSRERYIGLADEAQDIRERVKLVSAVLEAAHGLPAVSGADDTLKILMLPEFFFRGASGAYSMDGIQTAVSALQDLVRNAKWRHWMFVFGTIVGKSFPTRDVASGADKHPIDDDRKAEVYNYALVQKGGFGDGAGAGPAAAHAVIKQYLSGIDFIEQASLAGKGLSEEWVQHLQPKGDKRDERQSAAYDGAAVFRRDGLTFGVEICLDHLNGRLAHSLNRPAIDIQLIPSCGGYIKAGSIVARRDGYVFNCDGADYPLCRLQKVGSGDLVAAKTLVLDAGSTRAGELFAAGIGRLVAYPVQAL